MASTTADPDPKADIAWLDLVRDPTTPAQESRLTVTSSSIVP